MASNIINMTIRLNTLLIRLTKVWRYSPHSPCPMLHLQQLKLNINKHNLTHLKPCHGVNDMKGFGVPGVVSILGVGRCSHVTTNPGSAEQQDFGSLAYHCFIVYLHGFP